MADEPRQYLVIVQLGSTEPDRLAEVVPWIKSTLERLSEAPLEIAFRAVSADIFGHLVRSKLAAKQIEAAILRPNTVSRVGGLELPGGLDNKDHVFVLELGDDCAGSQGFSRALTWTQRH